MAHVENGNVYLVQWGKQKRLAQEGGAGCAQELWDSSKAHKEELISISEQIWPSMVWTLDWLTFSTESGFFFPSGSKPLASV